MATGNLSMFLFGDVYLSIGEVGEATGMVGIAVSQDDVPNVPRREAESFNTSNGGIRFVELETSHVDKRLSKSFNRVTNVLKSDPRINQSKLLAFL